MPRPRVLKLDHDDDAEAELLLQALPIVERFARRAWRRLAGRVDLDDLVAVGYVAALDAVRRFDACRARFLPYVTVRIRWRFMSEVRRVVRRSVREDSAIRLSTSRGGVVDPQLALARKRTRGLVRAAVATLREPARSLVEQHYFEDKRLVRAGADLGMGEHTAYRIHGAAVRELRRRLRRESLDELADTLRSGAT